MMMRDGRFSEFAVEAQQIARHDKGEPNEE